MKQNTIVSLVVLLVIAMAVSVQAEVVITHLGYENSSAAYNDYIKLKADEFNKLHPGIKVDVIIGNQEKMKVMMASGLWPDVLDMPDFSYLGNEGELFNVKPLLERDSLTRQYNNLALKRLTQRNGSIYIVPFEVGVAPAFFNRTMFNESGLVTPDLMGSGWTWDAMVKSGKKLTKDLDGNGVPERFGIDRPWNYWRTAVYQAGGTFYTFDENEQPLLSLWNTPEMKRGIEYTLSFYTEGITPHRYSLAGALVEKDYYYWTGKTAIDVTDGLSIIGPYLSTAQFDWDFCLQPAGPAGPITSSAGIAGPTIMSRTKNIEATWEWVKFVAMTRENVEQWVRATGRIPAMLSAQSVYPVATNLTKKNFKAVTDQINYPPPILYALDTFLTPRMVSLNTVFQGTVSVDAFLESTHSKMQAYIDEFRVKKGLPPARK